MKPSEALRIHRQGILEIIAAHSVSNPRVFGSVVRGEDTEESDLDILVDAEERTSYFDIIGAELEIEDLIGIGVDLISVGELKPHVKVQVLAEALPL
jgi:predicted nucleotidyltransferase